jgi:hypothetical protein
LARFLGSGYSGSGKRRSNSDRPRTRRQWQPTRDQNIGNEESGLVTGEGTGLPGEAALIGKHLRFSEDDIAQIMAEGARQPVTRARGTRR